MGSGAGEVLVHICCAPCATYCIKKLREDGYEPVGFFYNPNIYPQEEYEKRLKETQKIKNNFKFQLITGKYDTKTWSDYIRGFEHEPEGGKRCNKCFELRLKKTAKTAKEMNIKYFTTTLTVSPHKNVEVILQLGREIGLQYGVEFLPYVFRKENGYKRSVELSKELGLYRQNYCGCIFSMKDKTNYALGT